MKQILLIGIFVVPLLAFSQTKPRRLLAAQIVADSLDVSNVLVLNQNSKIHAISDYEGKFTIFATENDTLQFSSMAFNSRKIILSETDFESDRIKIKLRGAVNQLDEVVIYRVKLSGELNADSKKIKVRDIFIPSSSELVSPDYKRGEKLVNPSMLQVESQLTGLNFIRIGEQIAGIFGKSKSKAKAQPVYSTTEIFIDVVQQRFSYYFFTQTLKIKHDQIGLFLSFCDTSEGKSLLDPEKEFELTDFLIKKSAEFALMNKQ